MPIVPHRVPRTLLLVAVLLAAGCTESLRNEQLTAVAKDWALVVRASQVIPVYPLTEDLLPGDVLLVSTPLAEQQRLYEARGFLPLDQHLVRLQPTADAYRGFYGERFAIDADTAHVPGNWQARDADDRHAWSRAPAAAFPSYAFAVETGSSAGLALPVQGVPVALGYAGAGQASGSLTISDARTFGLDIVTLTAALHEWADAHRALLHEHAPRAGQVSYLRVVTRVYVVGGVDISLRFEQRRGGGATVGSGGPDVAPPGMGADGDEGGADGDEGEARSLLARINAAVNEDVLPGGSLAFSSFSARGAAMHERFASPLVLGYVGFDVPILAGGRLGAPLATQALLTGAEPPPTIGPRPVAVNAALVDLADALADDASGVLAELDALTEDLLARHPPPPLWVDEGDGLQPFDPEFPIEDFRDLAAFLNSAADSIEALDRALLAVAAGEVAQLRAARNALANWHGSVTVALRRSPVLVRAIDYAFLGLPPPPAE